MQVWYYGVCDNHKEAMNILVTNPTCTSHYLCKYDEHIQKFLSRHYACVIRLIHMDQDLDSLWGVYTVLDYKTGELDSGIPQPNNREWDDRGYWRLPRAKT